MKFIIRRAIAGLIAMPVVAGLYVLNYVLLALFGGGFSSTFGELWFTGFQIGFVVAVVFAFATQLDNFVARLVGE